MKKLIWHLVLLLPFVSACSRKELKQGSVTYSIEYQLPDSLHKYLDYLPKTAMVYFKGDSTVSIQQAGDEATTIITHKPTNFMRVLLRSSTEKFVIDYSKQDQADESPAKLGYTYAATKDTSTIAGHKALKYMLTDKETGLQSEAWFTKELSIVPNSLTAVFDTTYGVPLAFITNHNGMGTKTTAKEIKFEPVMNGMFSTPAGYQKMTAKQLREMPVK